jgi:hypothetical protein
MLNELVGKMIIFYLYSLMFYRNNRSHDNKYIDINLILVLF